MKTDKNKKQDLTDAQEIFKAFLFLVIVVIVTIAFSFFILKVSQHNSSFSTCENVKYFVFLAGFPFAFAKILHGFLSSKIIPNDRYSGYDALRDTFVIILFFSILSASMPLFLSC